MAPRSVFPSTQLEGHPKQVCRACGGEGGRTTAVRTGPGHRSSTLRLGRGRGRSREVCTPRSHHARAAGILTCRFPWECRDSAGPCRQQKPTVWEHRSLSGPGRRVTGRALPPDQGAVAALEATLVSACQDFEPLVLVSSLRRRTVGVAASRGRFQSWGLGEWCVSPIGARSSSWQLSPHLALSDLACWSLAEGDTPARIRAPTHPPPRGGLRTSSPAPLAPRRLTVPPAAARLCTHRGRLRSGPARHISVHQPRLLARTELRIRLCLERRTLHHCSRSSFPHPHRGAFSRPTLLFSWGRTSF